MSFLTINYFVYLINEGDVYEKLGRKKNEKIGKTYYAIAHDWGYCPY